MGHPKLISRAAKPAAGRLVDVPEEAKAIAKHLARFSGIRQTASRRVKSTAPQPAELRAEAKVTAARRWRSKAGLLLAGLGLAALIAFGVLWLGSQATLPRPRAEMPSAVLTAAERIKAAAGERVNVPIALDGTDGVPPRSVIAISGLPPGSNFSDGRPYGESEWNLRPDQIGDLTLIPPAGTSGEFRLTLALIAPDGKVIAETETLLEVSSVPPRQIAAAEVSVSPPVSSEPSISVGMAETSQIADLGFTPDLGLGSDAGTVGEPAAGAASPADEASAESAQQVVAPPHSGDARPNTVGQSDNEESGLGMVEPSVFVNLREGPSSSSPVLGVVAKGVKLAVLDRKRGWVQVAEPSTEKKGWIYSGLLVGEAKANHRLRRVAPVEAELKSESFWGRLGRWLSPSQENSAKEN